MKCSALAVFLFVLAGCGNQVEFDFDFSYGRIEDEGPNGLRSLHDQLAESVDLVHPVDVQDLEDIEALVAACRWRGLPPQHVFTELQQWLERGSDRFALLMLRDQDFTEAILSEWIEQCENAIFEHSAEGEHSAEADEPKRTAFRSLADRLTEERDAWRAEMVPHYRHIDEYDDDPWASMNGEPHVGMGLLEYGETVSFRNWQGSRHFQLPDEVPDRCEIGQTLQIFDSVSWRIVASANSRPLLVERMYGSGTLQVLLSAQPVLDGALVEDAARSFTSELLARALDGRRDRRWGWLRHLYRLDFRSEIEDSREEAKLHFFFRPPMVFILAHGLLFLLVLFFARSFFLGRRRQLLDGRRHHFRRHLEAMAELLRRHARTSEVERDIQRYREHKPMDADEAWTIDDDIFRDFHATGKDHHDRRS